MEAAATTRAVARAAVEDVAPPDLQSLLDARLAERSMAPGALTLASVRALGAGDPASDGAHERVAGVQLVYEGLCLTRRLVAEDPWAGELDGDIAADVDVLAADVLVARGFRLLARTEVSDMAVEIVREFGRDQTDVVAGRETDPRALERAIFELAVVTGATMGGGSAPTPLRQYATALVDDAELPLAPAATLLPADLAERLGRIAGAATTGAEGPTAARSANRND